MNEAEFLKSLIDLGSNGGLWATQITILVGMYKIWDKLNKMQENIQILNHNSTSITKALLRKGILDSEDIKDVNLA